MAKVERTKEFDVAPDELWELIGDFHGLHKWIPGVEPSEQIDGGKRRKLAMAGATLIEGLVREGERSYTYTIDESPLPVKDYESTLSVTEGAGGKSVVNWVGTFDPADGANEQSAVQIVEMVYDGGLAGLEKTLAGRA